MHYRKKRTSQLQRLSKRLLGSAHNAPGQFKVGLILQRNYSSEQKHLLKAIF